MLAHHRVEQGRGDGGKCVALSGIISGPATALNPRRFEVSRQQNSINFSDIEVCR